MSTVHERDLDFTDSPEVVLENEHLLASVDPARSARIGHLVDKTTGRDLVRAKREWGIESAGLFDERDGNAVWPGCLRRTLCRSELHSSRTGARARFICLDDRYKNAILPLTIEKHYSLAKGSRLVELEYVLRNTSGRDGAPLAIDLSLVNVLQPTSGPTSFLFRDDNGWQTVREQPQERWKAASMERPGAGIVLAFNEDLLEGVALLFEHDTLVDFAINALRGRPAVCVSTAPFLTKPSRAARFHLAVSPVPAVPATHRGRVRFCRELESGWSKSRPRRNAVARGTRQIFQGLPLAKANVERLKLGRISHFKGRHPRLFFSKDDLPSLAQKAKHEAMKPVAEHILAVAEKYREADETAFVANPHAVVFHGLYQSMAYFITGRPEHLKSALDTMRFHLRWGGPGGRVGFDFPVLYDWLHPWMTNRERRAAETTIVEMCESQYLGAVRAAGHLPRGHADTAFTRHCPNCLGWQQVALGMGALALAGDVKEAVPWLEMYLRTASGLMDFHNEEPGRDGEYFEGSCYYYAFMSGVALFMDALRNVAGIDFFRTKPWLAKNAKWQIHCSLDGATLVPFNDAALLGRHHSALSALYTSRFADPEVRWLNDKQTEAALAHWAKEQLDCDPHGKLPEADFAIWNFLWKDPSVPSRQPTAPLAKLYRGCHWAVLREGYDDGDVVFAMQGWKTVGHSHATQGHFLLTTGGEQVIDDPGYILTTNAHATSHHNCLTVDGEDQLDWDVDHESGSSLGCLRMDEVGEGLVRVTANLQPAYWRQLTHYYRTAMRLQKGLYLILDDAATPWGRPARFDWRLHAGGRFTGGSGRLLAKRGRAAVHVTVAIAGPYEDGLSVLYPPLHTYCLTQQATPCFRAVCAMSTNGAAASVRIISGGKGKRLVQVARGRDRWTLSWPDASPPMLTR